MKIYELPIGETKEFELLLLGADQAESKNGPYCTLKFTDGSAEFLAKMWRTAKADIESMIGQVVFATIKADSYGGRSYNVQRCIINPSGKISDFARMTEVAPEIYMEKTLKICEDAAGKGSSIYRIVEGIFSMEHEKILKSSAAKGVHHNLRGGLLQHTATIVEHANDVCRLYPFLNKGILCCAAALHDIGKIRELETTELGDAEYTPRGRLFGHALIGILMVEEMAKFLSIDKDDESVAMMEHCIASHHGVPEFGTIVTPLIPEAQALHFLDNMDAKMYSFHEAQEQVEPGSLSDGKIFAVGGYVYKPAL